MFVRVLLLYASLSLCWPRLADSLDEGYGKVLKAIHFT